MTVYAKLLAHLILPFCSPQLFRRFRLMSSRTVQSIEQLSIQFDNRNLNLLPVDPVINNYCRQVPNAIFSRVRPTPVVNPKLIAVSPSALQLLGLTESTILIPYLSGNEIIPGSDPASHCYCGHQFGSFAGQLGDGAAISLGEVINPEGERWELQLKGAGKTPYSRHADGRKVLRSTVREFLCSEAMHFLGIPTTRAGSCITSDSTVERDPLYNGTAIQERCTIVSRIAPNFFRFGSFEIFKKGKAETSSRSGPSAGNTKLLETLANHVVTNFFPGIVSDGSGMAETKYSVWLKEVVTRTALLAVKWQTFGFVHGVLNTDNFSIMGITIDYGPFGFLESFDKDFVPNGSDGSGRYSYTRQPEACAWALCRLSEAINPLLAEGEGSLAEVERLFWETYDESYLVTMRRKLGLLTPRDSDKALIESLLDAMGRSGADFTDTFRALTLFVDSSSSQTTDDWTAGLDSATLLDRLVSICAEPTALEAAMRRSIRISRPSMPPEQTMQFWNILQGSDEQIAETFGDHPIEELKAEIAAEKAKLDKIVAMSQDIKRLQSILPAEKSEADRSLWSTWVAEYVQRLREERLVGSSRSRAEIMGTVNPTFILRNWIAQEAISDAEKGEYAAVQEVLDMLSRPFDTRYCSFTSGCAVDPLPVAQSRFVQRPPAWAASLVCTCSS